jgi:hypothetical protein
MDWFTQLFGFPETDYEGTQRAFRVEGTRLRSLANQRTFEIGAFSAPSLGELRACTAEDWGTRSTLTHEVIGDSLEVQGQSWVAGDLFQVASQFNALEFSAPDITPEQGITRYGDDPTQGPACALAAAPATLYRNYFLPLGDSVGQRASRQLNLLAGLAAALPGGPYWTVKNGYTHSTVSQLEALHRLWPTLDQEALRDTLRIGLQTSIEVVFATRFTELTQCHTISQAFCAAISCGYTHLPNKLWEPLARLILEAAYEGTLRAAARDRQVGQGSGRAWLTLVGAGVFANERQWIFDALARAIDQTAHLGLDIRLCHHQRLQTDFLPLRTVA